MAECACPECVRGGWVCKCVGDLANEKPELERNCVTTLGVPEGQNWLIFSLN